MSFVGEPSQVAARRWAARLDHEHLQALTVEVNLRSRSSEEQRAAVAFMTPEQRSALLRSHIDGFLAAHPSLSPRQVASIKELVLLATPEALDRARDLASPFKKVLSDLRADLDPAIYAGLTSLVPPPQQQTRYHALAERLVSYVTLSAREVRCECIPPSDGGDGCGGGLTCQSNPSNNCDPSGTSCFYDIIFTTECIGLCNAA